MKFMNERCKNRLPLFNGTPKNDFHLWAIQIRAALRSKEVASTLTDDKVSSHILEKALAIIIDELINILLRVIQQCAAAKLAW